MGAMWSTRRVLDAIGPVKNCMPQDAFRDLLRCLHFADDWELAEDGGWDTIYSDVKVEPEDGTAKHRKEFSIIGDAYNRRWQACVIFGKWLTADESRIAGWYKSPITVGPEPKPIRTGATIHPLCVTKGILSTYKLFVRCYGGQADNDLDKRHPNTPPLLKFVTLYPIMLAPFMGKGHCVVMDSAYMSGVVGLIGLYVWEINMVGTAQSNRTAAGGLAREDLGDGLLGERSHKSLIYQHKQESLVYPIWADNNYVETLSNSHSPLIVEGGVKRGRIDPVTKRRQHLQSPVDCPQQQGDYSETPHLIDKGNGVGSKYGLRDGTKRHGWAPKIALRVSNMNLNNAYQLYCAVLEEGTNYKPMLLRDCTQDLTLDLLNQGTPMRERDAGAPPTGGVLSPGGREGRRDAKHAFRSPVAQGRNHPQTPRLDPVGMRATAYMQKVKFDKILKQQQWRSHQSMATATPQPGGYCGYVHCPNRTKRDNREGRGRPYQTLYRCVECSIKGGRNIYLCNTVKNIDGQREVISCHHKSHTQKSKLASPNGHPPSPANEPVAEGALETPETPVVPV